MPAPLPPGGRSLATVAMALSLLGAVVLTLASAGFMIVAPHLSLGDGGAGSDAGAVGGTPLGFSLTDAFATVLIAITLLLWAWVALDWWLVVAPLGRGALVEAEAPALLLGLLQLPLGGVLPGLLLVAASRQTRDAIRTVPELEARRGPSLPPAPLEGPPGARRWARAAMVGFGLLWCVAGIAMFQNQFYLYLPGLIRAAARGAPAILSGWFAFWTFASSLGGLPAAYVAGTLQLGLGVALVLGFARKVAYFVGVFAATFLWVVPEAFGGPFGPGMFSLGPGPVYAVGMLALLAFDASSGPAVASLDALLERPVPGWARIAEASVGLLPQIGRWYRRHASRLARGSEAAMGLLLAASAALAVRSGFPGALHAELGARLSAPAGPFLGWYQLWAQADPGATALLGWALVAVEAAIAVALILGIGPWTVRLAGIAAGLLLWAVVEGFGGLPGPGYTDPGVGIAEAAAMAAMVALAAVRRAVAAPRGPVEGPLPRPAARAEATAP